MMDSHPEKKGRLWRELDSELQELRRLEKTVERLEPPPARARRRKGGVLRSLLRLPPPAESRARKPSTVGFRMMQPSSSPSSVLDLACTALIPLQSARLPGKRILRHSLPEDLWQELRSRKWTGKEFEGDPARLIERFKVHEMYARGGLSQIYRADDTKSGRRVALKIIPASASELVRKTLPLQLRLKHPYILDVQDALELPDGTLFLVMPMLAGKTLREILFTGRHATGALLLAFRRACEGLAHAHGSGIVHRDIKPGNIQVQPDGSAVVLDWGMACKAGERGSTDQCIGTPMYMSPEQFHGGVFTPRTDVFALGTVLYEMLTGIHPTGLSDDLQEIMHRACEEAPPPPSVLRDGIPTALDDVVLRCLAKDPAERPESAVEVLEELEGM